MRTLIAGAGATGGYLAAVLVAGGRDVTLLVRQNADRGVVRLRVGTGAVTETPVPMVTRDHVESAFDIVVVAVRSDAVAAALDDVAPAVGRHTRVVPLVNGLDHLDCLTTAFGVHRTVGATAKMATSRAADGIIDVVVPGIALQLGTLDGSSATPLADEFAVDGIAVQVLDQILPAMTDKFGFIAATAALTCLARGVVGDVVTAPGGGALVDRLLREVGPVAGLPAALTDPASRFAPSMYRDLVAGRPVEVGVLTEFTRRARQRGVNTPLLDATVVALEVHNKRLRAS